MDENWECKFLARLLLAFFAGWVLAQLLTISVRLHTDYQNAHKLQHEARVIQQQIDANESQTQAYINQITNQVNVNKWESQNLISQIQQQLQSSPP